MNIVTTLTIVLFFYVILTVYSAVTIFFGKIFGLKLQEVGFFSGPKLIKFRLNGVLYHYGLFPSGNLIRFYDPEKDESENPPQYPDQISVNDLHLTKRLILILSGCFALFVLSVAILNAEIAIDSLCRGFNQIFIGAFAPFTKGQEYIQLLSDLIKVSPLAAFAILASKFLAFNLVPYFGSPTYIAIFACIKSLSGRKMGDKIDLLAAAFLFFPFVGILLSWIMALVKYSFSF